MTKVQKVVILIVSVLLITLGFILSLDRQYNITIKVPGYVDNTIVYSDKVFTSGEKGITISCKESVMVEVLPLNLSNSEDNHASGYKVSEDKDVFVDLQEGTQFKIGVSVIKTKKELKKEKKNGYKDKTVRLKVSGVK